MDQIVSDPRPLSKIIAVRGSNCVRGGDFCLTVKGVLAPVETTNVSQRCM